MALNKFKSLLSSAMAVAALLSTIPAVTVAAAEVPVLGFDDMSPIQFEAVRDLYIDRNHVNWDSLREIKYNGADSEIDRTEYQYDPGTGYLIKKTQSDGKYCTYEYDSSGNQIRSNSYDADGLLLSHTTGEYDGSGNILRYNQYDGNDKLTNYTIYERTFYNNGTDKTYSSTDYELQGDSFVIAVRFDYEYNENGKTIKEIRYKYDNDKKELYIDFHREYEYDGDIQKCDYVYNSEGELISSTIPFSIEYNDGEVCYWYNYHDTMYRRDIYRKFGDTWYLVENLNSFTYSVDNAHYKTIIERNESGQILVQSTYDHDKLSSKTVYEYNEGGFVSRVLYYHNGNFLMEYTVYEYIRNESFDNGHHIPDFDAYIAPDGCVFNYRLYNPYSYEHFYTGSKEEALYLTESGWNFEGPGFVNPTAGDAVYRLYNSDHGDHIYTMDKDEINGLLKEGWAFDGGAEWTPAFPSATKENGQPMYRLHNTNAWNNDEAGAFHFTMSEEERDHLVSLGWKDQGIGWYSV